MFSDVPRPGSRFAIEDGTAVLIVVIYTAPAAEILVQPTGASIHNRWLTADPVRYAVPTPPRSESGSLVTRWFGDG